MKKLTSLFLPLVMAFALLSTASGAEVVGAEGYTYQILLEDSTVSLGDIITVTLELAKEDGADYTLYGMQDYLCFDPAYFSYVADSIWVLPDVDGAGEEGFQASPLEFQREETNRVFVNRSTSCAMAGESTKILSFQLEAIQIGTTQITHDTAELLDEDTTPLSFTAQSITIDISAASTGNTDDTGNSGGGSTGSTTEDEDDLILEEEIMETQREDVCFSDVADTSLYYYEAVQFAVEYGITSGTSDTEFSPDAYCTRAQIVTFLYRLVGEPETSGAENFEDLDSQLFYSDAVAWAVEHGITAGVSDTSFAPDLTCTRGQIVTFLYRLAGEPDVSGGMAFGDVDGDAYYAKAVIWAVEQGITTGLSDDVFAPDDPCTRAQVVTFIYRYIGG